MENVVTLEDIGNRIWSKLKPGIAGVGFKQVEAPETFSATPCLKVSWNSPGEPPKKRAHANPGSTSRRRARCAWRRLPWRQPCPAATSSVTGTSPRCPAGGGKCFVCKAGVTGSQALFSGCSGPGRQSGWLILVHPIHYTRGFVVSDESKLS